MRGRWVAPVLFLLLAWAPAAPASGEGVAWLTDTEVAWQRAVEQGQPLLVFITRPSCKHCTRMRSATFANPGVAADIARGFVPLAIDQRVEPGLVRELNVTAFPTMLIISESGLLGRMTGFVPPQQMRQRLSESRMVHQGSVQQASSRRTFTARRETTIR
jgi:thioredoxin-related protein